MTGWSDVPDWISAIATVFALTFAAIAAIAARKTYVIESERDRVNAAARSAQDAYLRRSQAAFVSAWWSDTDQGAFVRNGSDSPVYQAFLTVHQRVSADIKIDIPVVPPDGRATLHPIEKVDADLTGHRVSLTFTDASGVRWERDRYGRLTELDPRLLICTSREVAGVLSDFATDMCAAYGVAVEFETENVSYDPLGEELRSRYALIGGGDILVAPHDWVGELVESPALEKIILPANRRAAFQDWTLDAMSIDGALYGIPIALDTMALVRNMDLAPDPPATMEELIAIGTRLRSAGRVQHVLALMVGDRGDPFQVWPLISSGGGWLFGRTSDGGWDPHTIGLAEPETVAAFERIRELGDAGRQILRRGVDAASCADAFLRQDVAFLLTTANQAMAAANAGLPVAVTAIPPFEGGGPATSFVSVTGMLISRFARNKAIAQDLVADYLTREDVMLAQRRSLGTVTPLKAPATGHSVMDAYAHLCVQGMPMPSFPHMGEVWRLLSAAEIGLIAGEDALSVARRTAAKVSALFASPGELGQHGTRVG